MKPVLFLFFVTFCFNAFAASKVLVTVNGHEITQAAVENFMTQTKKSISPQEALSKMITVEILASKRLEKPILKDSTLQLELDRNRKGIIANDLLEEIVRSFSMTPEELKAEYEKQYLSDTALQEYNANHILLKTKDEAMTLIRQLNEGADFNTLAKEYSTGPSGKKGGALGWFNKNKMVKPFSDATVALSKGTFTQEPVKTQFGWHIIKLNDVRKNTPPDLKSVADKIKRRDAAIKLQKEIAKLQQEATITFNK